MEKTKVDIAVLPRELLDKMYRQIESKKAQKLQPKKGA